MFEYTYATFMNDMEPSKNYVVVRRSEGVNDFVTYCYVNFEGEGGILWDSYVTADT